MTRGRRMPGQVRAGGLILALAGVLALAACSSSSSPTTSSTSSSGVKTGGSLTFALDEDIAGFNSSQAADNEFVLAEIMDNIWPEVYVIKPDLTIALDTNYVTSAKVTNQNPQTVVYQINPKATWSDGTPFNADDFIYNWQAQSGNSKYTDVGGKAYEPVGTTGYDQISSVTGSNNGKTVTVVFSKPFGDWQSLFGTAYGMVPAHIGKTVGFNNGFQNFGPSVQVSGGPYEIQSYTKGESLVEVRNPKWWGPKGKLDKIIFTFENSDDQAPPAIQNGEVNMVNPALASVSFYDQVKQIAGFTTSVKPGLEFQHMDFNQANPYLAKQSIRQAIAYGTNRQEITTRTAGELQSGAKPLNNRIYMATQPQFTDNSNGLGDFNPTQAKTLLQQSGMTMGSDGYFQPNFGPEKGKDFSLRFSTTSGVPVRAQIEQLFQAQMKSIGVKIVIQNYPAATFFGTVLPKLSYDIGEFAWVQSPFASGTVASYCSYTKTQQCGNNWLHYANPQVDQLFSQALTTVDPTQAASLYNQADALMWKDMATLPLFQQPVLYGWSSSYGNIQPNTSQQGIPWNAYAWGKM